MQGLYRSTPHSNDVVLTLYERTTEPNAQLKRPSRRPLTRQRLGGDRHDVRASAQAIEAIHPSLHHLASFVETLCTIVGSPNLVAFRVSELKLNRIEVPSLLVQQRTRRAAKAVTGYLLV